MDPDIVIMGIISHLTMTGMKGTGVCGRSHCFTVSGSSPTGEEDSKKDQKTKKTKKKDEDQASDGTTS